MWKIEQGPVFIGPGAIQVVKSDSHRPTLIKNIPISVIRHCTAPSPILQL